MQALTQNIETGRDIYLLALSSIEELQTISLPSQYFSLFLVSDSAEISGAPISDTARWLLKQGLVSISVWGEDCERVNDLFDEEIVSLFPDETDDTVILTVWYAKDTLDKALWNYLNLPMVANAYLNDCKAEIIVVIGNPQRKMLIQEWLVNQPSLNEAIAGKDDDGGDE